MKQTLEYIKQRLEEYPIENLYDIIIERYSEPHRYYHNVRHICKMVEDTSFNLSDNLLMSILFHDVVYNPMSDTNEFDSAELYKEFIGDFYEQSVYNAILETKTHEPRTELSKQLCELDLRILSGSFSEFMEFERGIFKEYQFVDYSIYINHRIPILETLGVNETYIDWVKNRKVNIAIYPVSFNPFHKGHLDILKKAERIFDKVIIAQGINKSKGIEYIPLVDHEYIKFHQVLSYSGLLTDTIKSLGYEVTVIRGLRNASDLQYETTQYRFLTDLMPDIKVVSIICDSKYEHISSSALRHLKEYNTPVDFYI